MQNLSSNNISTAHVENQITILKKVSLDILRLDKIHPVVSGNKWFKLQYYLRDASQKGFQNLLSFGGAYSNHIAATAYAAKEYGFNSIGVIRGEEPREWSHTLQEAGGHGMKLIFLPRSEFTLRKRNNSIAAQLEKSFGRIYIIPEGGYGIPGMNGAADILGINNTAHYSHIVGAVGTGTTIAGIIKASANHQQIIGISSMKNNLTLTNEIQSLLNVPLPRRFQLIHDYHFGGFARHNSELLEFMNSFYHKTHIPLDFVYTGKMMYGIFDMMGKDFFPPHSHILAIHSGGLQGNLSLSPDILKF